MQTAVIERIVSGGQTGVDRAALDAAIRLGIPCGGWCPRGRRAEDGVIPEQYPLMETTSINYSVRTERNIRDSDGTLIICRGGLTGGTALTKSLARKSGRPLLVVNLRKKSLFNPTLEWLELHAVRSLNVAGPRESQQPGIHAETLDWMLSTFGVTESQPGTGPSRKS